VKCKDVTDLFMETDIALLPEDVREHIAGCPDCRRFLDDNRFVTNILSVKRHETISSEMLKRCSEGIFDGISEGVIPESTHISSLDIPWLIKPVSRIAVASIFIILIGGFFFKQHIHPEVSSSTVPTPNISENIADITSSPPDWMDNQTNASPDDIRYGPRTSAVVDFSTDDR